jgi:hypothetical protein
MCLFSGKEKSPITLPVCCDITGRHQVYMKVGILGSGIVDLVLGSGFINSGVSEASVR